MKKRLCFLILVLGIILMNDLRAQTPKLDSLRDMLKKDTTDLDVMIKLSAFLGDINVSESMVYAAKAKAVAIAQGDTSYFVTSSRILGQLYNRRGDVYMAIKELAPVLPIAERHNLKVEIKTILNSLAIAFSHTGEYDKSLHYHLKSLTLKEKDNDKKGVSVSLNNIGVVYFNVNNFDRALHYWKRCLDLKLEINDRYDLDLLYLNLGQCYKEFNDFERSQSCLEKVLVTCSPNCSKRTTIRVANLMGELQLEQKNFESAKKYLEKSLQLSSQENDLELKMENLVALTQMAFAEHDLTGVKNYLNEISRLTDKEQFAKPLQLFYKFSVDFYNQTGNFAMANQFERKHSLLSDKINSADVHRRLMEIQINFIEAENREKLEGQQKLVVAQAKVIENQYIISLLLFGIAALTIILLIVFFKLNVKKTAINKRLDELVRERTFELESSRNELVHAYDEQKIVLHKISSNLISSLATISGLVNVGSLENFENASTYLKATERTLARLVESVNWLDHDTEKHPKV